MVDGKKSLAERIVYDALALVGERTGKAPVDVLDAAIKELTPVLEVRSRRVGGATYQVPVEVPARRARTLAVRWLVQFARGRREKSMHERLAPRSWTRPTSRAAPGSARTTSTAWRRPTRPSPTTAGSRALALMRARRASARAPAGRRAVSLAASAPLRHRGRARSPRLGRLAGALRPAALDCGLRSSARPLRRGRLRLAAVAGRDDHPQLLGAQRRQRSARDRERRRSRSARARTRSRARPCW